MTDKEICHRYSRAESKSKHIQILAELNATSRTRIARILLAAGYPVKVPKTDPQEVEILAAEVLERRLARGRAYIRWTEEMKSTLVKSYNEGKRAEELSDMLGVSKSSVHTRLSRLRKEGVVI